MMRLEQTHDMTYTQKFHARLSVLLLERDFEPTELISGLAATGWGAMVGNPWVDTFTTSPSFRAMASLASEWVWGLALFGIGIVQLAMLFRDLAVWRQRVAFVAMIAWGFIAATLVVSNPWSTGSVVYSVLAFAATWAYWRLSLLLRPSQSDEL